MIKMKAIRVEIPEDLYRRLQKCVENDYTNITSLTRSLIVDYVKESEDGQKKREEWLIELDRYSKMNGEKWRDGNKI